MTAGMAANRPMAVANRASAMPGATTARLVLFAAAMLVKLRMMPHTVPNSPTKGATEPTVARMLSRSDRRSTSAAVAVPSAAPRRWRVPSRSMLLPPVERRHSAMPAASRRAADSEFPLCLEWKASMSLAAQNSLSNWRLSLSSRDRRRLSVTMMAQVQIEASKRPTMTALTTMSACTKSARGDMTSVPALTPTTPRTFRPTPGAGVWAGLRAR